MDINGVHELKLRFDLTENGFFHILRISDNERIRKGRANELVVVRSTYTATMYDEIEHSDKAIRAPV